MALIEGDTEEMPTRTAKLIRFPVPNRDDVPPHYFVMGGEDEVCMMHNLPNARNIARLLHQDWPQRVYTVVDEGNEVLFTTEQELN